SRGTGDSPQRVLAPGQVLFAVGALIRERHSGCVAIEVDEGIRRVVLRDGDVVTAASGVHGDSLVAFLVARGAVPAELSRQGLKLAASGRRAGAALIAHGHLAQEELWPTLRAHAEWLLGKVCRTGRGKLTLEAEAPDRLRDEPAVFGGATGAEVLVEVVRRVTPPEEAVDRLGGPGAGLGPGAAPGLLTECALPSDETEAVRDAVGTSVAELIGRIAEPSFPAALLALSALGVLEARAARAPARKERPVAPRDALDDQAIRARVLARKALVDEGDYFALLGLPRDATGYDVRRAYAALRREFEPSRLLTPVLVDLTDAVDEIREVLDEAYEILGEARRRERYRRAIEAEP
ncbi:MAG: J domain-containing protein, partial [Deltaproteobacteria bacterium]|nr:J domain-containing protein [Deltaproteobacteria bacterium]